LYPELNERRRTLKGEKNDVDVSLGVLARERDGLSIEQFTVAATLWTDRREAHKILSSALSKTF
jgi:hypothetical protein